MPRTGRGGQRTGATQTAYSNRTDLNGPVPIEAAPNQTYGEAASQRAAQRVIPVSPLPQPAPAPAPVGAAGQPSGMAIAPRQQKPVIPGSLPFLQPTDRPDEPITTGMPFGAGAGPEVLGAAPPTIGDTFTQLAQGAHTSPLISALAAAARTLGV